MSTSPPWRAGPRSGTPKAGTPKADPPEADPPGDATGVGPPGVDPPAVPLLGPESPGTDEALRALLGGQRVGPAVLLDERSRPDFRDLFLTLVRQSVDVAVAVTRVRLSTLDLEWDDLARVESLRVLVVELNALTLDAEARLIQADPRRASRVALYRQLLEAGRLEVRSAPLGGWTPDFSVFAGPEGPSAALLGRHWFERPYPHRGPALTSIHLADSARLTARRHRALWDTAHDVGPAVWSILSKAERARRAAVAVAG